MATVLVSPGPPLAPLALTSSLFGTGGLHLLFAGLVEGRVVNWVPISLLRVPLCCSLLLGTLIGCLKQDGKTVSSERLPVKQVGNEREADGGGEAPVAKHPKRGFQEYVKNPDLFREEAGEMERERAAQPPTPREVAGLVSEMGRRRLKYDELERVKQAGDAAVPLLQKALRDEKFLLHRYGKDIFDGSVIETALDILEPFALPEASLLEPALRHSDEFFRYHALFHLARCGNDDAIDALKSGLKSPSAQCRTWTLMGLEFLKRTGRGSKAFRAVIFEAALPLLADKEYNPAEYAPRALLALDFRRAQQVLLGEDVFYPQNKYVYKVLQALKDANVPVPGPQLRKLLSEIKPKAAKFPFDYAYAEGLILLARAEGSGARDLIGDAQSWGNAEVKEGAAKALEIAAGVNDAYGFVMDLYQRKGAKGLAETQLYYLTLSWLDAEVRNGGFSQYYFNSSGALASYAVKAAQSVGASELAAIIEKANALFGKDGPDPDRGKRMDQLSKIDLAALTKLDSQYYECADRLSELLPKFVSSNSEAFKRAK
jgi:hypothetical protein